MDEKQTCPVCKEKELIEILDNCKTHECGYCNWNPELYIHDHKFKEWVDTGAGD